VPWKKTGIKRVGFNDVWFDLRDVQDDKGQIIGHAKSASVCVEISAIGRGTRDNLLGIGNILKRNETHAPPGYGTTCQFFWTGVQ